MKQLHPGLYIHVPFCISKCPYCDFYSITDTGLIDAWLAALEREILLYRKEFSCFDTVYLGGGTPSVLPEPVIEKLLAAVFKYFLIASNAEITIEANPNDVNPEKLLQLHSCGINRISLGVQSFDERVLSILKRRHTASEARNAIILVRQAGFTNLSIDLMYGIPGQTMKCWMATLKEAVACGPEHISCYQLTIKEKTPFRQLQQEGILKPLKAPDEERFFLATAEFLESHGYLQYEVSSFACNEKHVSAHNQKYWHHVPYLGLGPSAHSFQNSTRWWNCSSVQGYIRMLGEGVAPVLERETISEEQRRMEMLLLRFRTSRGIDLETFKTFADAEEILRRLIEQKLVSVSDNRVVPTKQGLLVADSLPLLLV